MKARIYLYGVARFHAKSRVTAQYLDKYCCNGFIRMDGSHYSCSLASYTFPYIIDAEL